MKNHIIKVLAVVMAVMMLVGVIPASALPEMSFTAQDGTSIFDNVTLGKDVVTNTENYMEGVVMATGPITDKEDNGKIAKKNLSPYEPYSTMNENHPFLPGGSAWVDASKIYYGAPATQNFPVTDWAANTSVYNISGTNKKYSGGLANGEEIFLFPDSDLIDGYTWVEFDADDRLAFPVYDQNGDVVVENGEVKYTGDNEHGVAGVESFKYGLPVVEPNDSAETAFAYNRYDAAQGKYGITLDRNVQTVRWSPSYKANYYPDSTESDGFADYFGSVVNISDTPYLYFSTEAQNTTKIAISILIGTPVQKEVGYSSGTKTTNTGYFEYRWYTITDDSDRPGVAADSRNLSMMPKVTVSDPVGVFKGNSDTYLTAYQQQNDTVIPGLDAQGKLDPIALAAEKGINTDTLFTDGAITGCYDFSNILPTIYGNYYRAQTGTDTYEDRDNGREDAHIKIAQIRVDVKTADGVAPAASRVNYLYFGPSLVTTYLPQTLNGSEVCASNWSYSQQPAGTNSVGADGKAGTSYHAATDTATERAYTSGWENGAAVSIVNTPETPQLYTVDIHGKGDGVLIDWEDVPASANIRRNAPSKATKVWKFTDNNNVVQYMEAELIGDPNGSVDSQVTGNYVVMVTIPVRKWVNVLGEARKVSVTATLLNNGKDASGKTNTALRPSFTFWGNDDGSLGFGHGNLGTRFRHEDLLMVFGQKYQVYHTDNSGDYICAEVDRTIGDSTIYNTDGKTDESWYDCLRSPYFYEHTVKGANSYKKLTDDHSGYAFITSLRFAMPIDSAISIQNMKGDGNSAGLNTYSATGEIVSAYDGGTGAQPEINVTNTLTAKKATIAKKSGATGNASTDYNYSFANGETIKGTIDVGASAAYGPMLKESYYTIYDMLDTELITAMGTGSHKASNPGKANLPVYGAKWKNNNNAVVPLYSGPRTDSSIYGYVYENCECTVYYRLNVTDSSGSNIESWGLTGVVTKGGTPELAWVPLWIKGKSYSFSHTGGEMIKVESMTRDKVPGDWYAGRNQLTALKNSWVLSNMNGGYGGNFLGYDGSGSVGFDYGDGSNDYVFPKDIHNPGNYNGNTLQYANGWNDPVAGTNSGPNVSDAYLYTKNGTDLVFGMKRNKNTSKNWSVAMTRVFDEPVTLKQGKTYIHGSYPVLYVDYDVPNTGSNSGVIALSMTIDGTPYLYHVYGNSGLTQPHHGITPGNRITRYFSFEDIMTVYAGKEIKITGLSLYMWVPSTDNATTVEMTLRRCEVWQEETDWLDTIISANQQQGGNTSTQMNDKVYDSMNIINDAFYNVHNEGADGSYTVTKTDSTYASNSGWGKDGQPIFSITDKTNASSLKKENSNKGWEAKLVINDDDNKATVGGSDTTYHSYDGYGQNGAYQYSTAVGNLRFWCPANTDGSLVFESDRSYGIGNYRYLYYSYSMRDVAEGISAEESVYNSDITKKGPGMALAIKSTNLGSAESYLEHSLSDGTRTFAYYPSGHAYWSEDGRDARSYVTAVNAAIDLSTFKNINSINQIVLYFNNTFDKEAEFYVNYIMLSNEPPEALIANRMEKEGVQYYYMMDNTGDRYSSRFPTIDNPTGEVTGHNSDNDRVNPVVIKRGGRISDGTYFNGDKIYGYGRNTVGSTLDQDSASPGYYEKTYGTSDGLTGSMKNIMFYAGTSSSLDDINDFYMYRKADGSDGDIYDMKWTYGRWDLGTGTSGLNTMYVGNPNNLGENDTADVISGRLTRRYATENYVLLRVGIKPKKYATYYDANGGEFIYGDSSSKLQNLQTMTENSYYVNQTVIQSYFNNSYAYQSMKHGSDIAVPFVVASGKYYTDSTKKTIAFHFDSKHKTFWLTSEMKQKLAYYWLDNNGNGTPNPGEVFSYASLQKPGYIFSYWQKCSYNGVANNNFNKQNGVVPPGAQNGSELLRFVKKTAAEVDYFKAVWVEDPAYKGKTFTATFYTDNKYKTQLPAATVGTEVDANNGKFVLTMPKTTRVKNSSGTVVTIYGWKVKGDTSGTTFAPGDKLYLLANTSFEPVTDASKAKTFTIKLSGGAKLFVRTVNGNELPIENYGITCSGTSTRTYSKIPANLVLVAKPDTVKSNYRWTETIATSNTRKEYLTSANVLEHSNQKYVFTACENITIKYGSLADSSLHSIYKGQDNIAITTTAEPEPDNREMHFISSYDLPEGSSAQVVAFGTLYTNQKYYDIYGKSGIMNEMKLNENTVNATTVANKNYSTAAAAFRYVHASAETKTDCDEYKLIVTETKGNAIKYYVRAYVIYTVNGEYRVAYGNIIANTEIAAKAQVGNE